MKNIIIRNGIIAGLIVGVPMMAYFLSLSGDSALSDHMMAMTYILMLVALSMVFVGIKQYRDRVLGGVIGFGPALLVGLGISAIAGLFYAAAWEICQAFMRFDFTAFYAKQIVDQARANGADERGLAEAAERATDFTQMYANPLVRIPMTFLEIFPVGILVSLVSAALLKNSRFLPARARAQ